VGIESSAADTAVALIQRETPSEFHDYLHKLSVYVTPATFADFRIAAELETRTAVQPAESIEPFLKLAPVHTPAQHTALSVVRSYRQFPSTLPDFSEISEILHSGFAVSSQLLTDLENMITGVFMGKLEPTIEQAAIEALGKAIMSARDNDIFLAAFAKESALIAWKYRQHFPPFASIPFRWSQFFIKLIAANPRLGELVRAVHAAFTGFLSDASGANPLVKALVASLDDDSVQKLKPVSDVELKCGTELRTRRSFHAEQTALPKFQRSLSFGSLFYQPVSPPLVDESQKALFFSLYQENFDDSSITCSIVLVNGRKLSYLISPRISVDVCWTLLCDLLSHNMNRTPECYRRAQRISVVRSMELSGGFHLVYGGGGQLLARRIYLSEWLQFQTTHTVPSPPKPNCHFTSTESLIEWFWHFASRYSAISILQVGLQSPIPNPYDIIFDSAHAAISLARIEPPRPEFALFRTSGMLSSLLERPILLGPMRTAIITAAQSFVLYRNSTALFLQACLDVNHREFLERAAKFSVRDSEPKEVLGEVENLIRKSMENQADVFAIPWI
jgi:hypothetical protein